MHGGPRPHPNGGPPYLVASHIIGGRSPAATARLAGSGGLCRILRGRRRCHHSIKRVHRLARLSKALIGAEWRMIYQAGGDDDGYGMPAQAFFVSAADSTSIPGAPPLVHVPRLHSHLILCTGRRAIPQTSDARSAAIP